MGRSVGGYSAALRKRKNMEKNLKTLLSEHRVNLKKQYGQNFLTDGELLLKIVTAAGVTEKDVVLEIGCGAGALTKRLSAVAKKVIGYEIDERLKPVLKETLEGTDNAEIIFKDVMKENVSDLERRIGGEYVIVANLPYYITTPIVMNFLENAKNLKSMTIMVQEEVAERFSASAGESEYGAITVGINLRGKASTVLKVPREKFTPVPNVDSAVVRIDMERGKNAGVDLNAVRNVVRIAFSSRRKMLVNNLINGLKISRDLAETALKESGISLTARGETLTADEFITLAETLEKTGIK